ncbi:cytosol aminopeptidase family, catalytic domain-containing protein, partial [Mycena amicta]
MATATIHPFDPKAPIPAASSLWPASTSKHPKASTTRVFFSGEKDSVTALASLGPDFTVKTGDARREVVRRAVGSAMKQVVSLEDVSEVVVDGGVDPHATAVAARLASYKFTLKTDSPSRLNARGIKALSASPEWERGIVYGEAQNLARTLMELPGNMLTPTLFAERIQKEFSGVAKTEVLVRDEAWAKEKGMRTFLSVCRGSSEPGKFVEIHYKGASSPDAAPLVLVGKGITFDSGGISLKPSA